MGVIYVETVDRRRTMFIGNDSSTFIVCWDTVLLYGMCSKRNTKGGLIFMIFIRNNRHHYGSYYNNYWFLD